MSKVLVDRELLPCPFCGQQEAFVEQLDSDASVVICQGMVDEHSACLARGPVGVQQSDMEEQPGRDAAVAEWNRRARPAEAEGVDLVPFWVLFDATTPEPLIKKHMPEGVLAFFDNEEDARRAKALHPGTDYKRAPYVRAAALSAVTAERDAALASLERAYANYNQVSYASTERGKQIDQLRAEVEGLRKAFMKMRNVAAGYSNCCEFDSANTRRLEREFEAADELFRSSAALAAKEA